MVDFSELAACDCDVAEACDEMVDQRRLADTGFAGDPDHPTPAAARCIPGAAKPGQRFGATNEGCRFKRAALRNARSSRRGRCYRSGRGDEAIAAARDRFDETWMPGIVVERGPQVADRRFQHRIADELVAPYFVEQLMLGEQRPGLPYKGAEQRKWGWRQSDRLPIALQARVHLVQF